MGERPDAILIAGPTASGKSALALALAKESGGVVVNADSMQVYDVLSILTARPDASDLAACEHRLYGHVPPSRAYSVAQWLEDACVVLRELSAQGRTAIFVGGTGLYFTALTQGLSSMPSPKPEIRAAWRARALEEPQSLHGELARRDSEGAGRISPSDTQRLVRALEIFDSTGLPIGHFQREGARHAPLAGLKVERRLLMPVRERLHARISERFDAMLEAGAVDEVRALLALDVSPDLPAMKAIGVPQLAAWLGGRMRMEEAAEAAKAASRQYAKRQMTWFRNQFGEDWVVHERGNGVTFPGGGSGR